MSSLDAYQPKPDVRITHPEWSKNAAIYQLSGEAQTVTFSESLYHGTYQDYFGEVQVVLGAETRLEMEPWGYKVFGRVP